MNLKSLFFAVLICNAASVFSQEDFTVINTEIIPPSPQATSIVVGARDKASLYTGGINISIPIYSINSIVDVPIALDYTGGNGIRVDELASSVGLGWQLSPCGVVSRVSRGLPDEKNNGFQGISSVNLDDGTHLSLIDYWEGIKDGEPDQYNYSAPGIYGKFYVGPNNKIVQTTITNRKIEIKSGANGFKITAPNGIEYHFDVIESTLTANLYPIYPIPEDPESLTSSWYLSKIVNANHTDSIVYKYSPSSKDYQSNYSDTTNHLPYNRSYKTYSPVAFIQDYRNPIYRKREVSILNARNIDTIYFSNGYVKFNYGEETRKDYVGAWYIDNVEVFNNNDKLIKKQFFKYSYWYESSIVSMNHAIIDPDKARLKLDKTWSLDEYGHSDNGHEFTYYNEGAAYLPSRFSFAKDHWGYYNGENNTTLLPNTLIKGSYMQPNYLTIGNADRDTKETFCYTSILTSIKYPTGGKLVLDYETHNYISHFGYYTGDTIKGGGLRIKKITKYEDSGDTHISLIKQYSYSDGRLITPLVYGIYPYIPDARKYQNAGPIAETDNINSRVPIYKTLHPLLSSNESNVCYGKVKESFSENNNEGLITYTYSTPDLFPDYRLIKYSEEKPFEYDHFIKDGVKTYLWPLAQNNSQELFRGLLLKKEVFKKDNNILKLAKSIERKYLCFSPHIATGITPLTPENSPKNIENGYYGLKLDQRKHLMDRH